MLADFFSILLGLHPLFCSGSTGPTWLPFPSLFIVLFL